MVGAAFITPAWPILSTGMALDADVMNAAPTTARFSQRYAAHPKTHVALLGGSYTFHEIFLIYFQ